MSSPHMIKFDILNRFSGAVEESAERLRELLSYDPDTGVFTYKTRAAQCVRIGDVAGSVNSHGYRHIRVDGRVCKAHRLAWLYMTGRWPNDELDHANCIRDDNRFSNLREASRSQNMANRAKFRQGKQAPKGVSFNRQSKKWAARVQRCGQSVFIGYFDSEATAAAAYAAAAHAHFGSFART